MVSTTTREFADDTVVVTGAASGIGKAIAKRFAMEGARVVLTDLDTDAGASVAAAINEDTHGSASFTRLDVRDEAAMQALVSDVAETYGIDVFVNNAGVVASGPLLETSIDERDHLIDVNVRGVWNGCYAAIPAIKQSGGGSIVNISSTAGLLGTPGVSTYAMTKAAVVNFTRAVAGEVGSDDIRVNAVCPGTIDTPMAHADFNAHEDPVAARRDAAAATVLGRIGEPEEVATPTTFLASSAASYITGVALPVDGGTSATLRTR